MDFNKSPMSACVGQIEKDKIYIVDEIVIYGSNTDEMCQEIRDRYGSKIPIFIYPDPACRPVSYTHLTLPTTPYV